MGFKLRFCSKELQFKENKFPIFYWLFFLSKRSYLFQKIFTIILLLIIKKEIPFLIIESIFNIFDYMLPDLIKRCIMHYEYLKALSSQRQFLANPLKMMKNTLYFILKALLVLKIFKFMSWRFGHVENSLIRKIRKRKNFKIHDFKTWLTNNCNTHINQYLKQ